MEFSDTLKNLRKEKGLSQEKLAEQLNVSRQAITKWETGVGVPDLENLMAVGQLFNISIDDLLKGVRTDGGSKRLQFESTTEYDISKTKSYDLDLGGAKEITVIGYEGEKIYVKAASDTIEDIQRLVKVRIDDIRQRIDVEVRHTEEITEAQMKQEVSLSVHIPLKYMSELDITGNAKLLNLEDLGGDKIEFSGRVSTVYMKNVTGHTEFDVNVDVNIICDSLNGRIDINQINATSKITIPHDAEFMARKKGIGNKISFEAEGQRVDSFTNNDAQNLIELNGMKSELVIARSAKRK